MRLSTTLPAAVLCLCAAVAAAAWYSHAPPPPDQQPTGMELLRNYPCHRAESKVVLVKGVEDDFSPAGDEPGSLRPGLDHTRTRSIYGDGGQYDQLQSDRWFVDHLLVPPRIRNGLFVIGLKAVSPNDNDTIRIGGAPMPGGEGDFFSNSVVGLAGSPGWHVRGTLHHAELDRLLLMHRYLGASERTLVDYLRSSAQPRLLDVVVQDDTAVDFIGLAACVEPERGRGMTMVTDMDQTIPGMVLLTCNYGPSEWIACDPYVGDTPCETPLPVACLLPGGHPRPRLPQKLWTWSGGDIALTEPVPATRFRSIDDVDRFCAARMGEGWRTLEIHDGESSSQGVSGYGDAGPLPVRIWIDVVDQPYATCWTR